MEVKKETDVKYVHYGDIHTNIADEIDKNNNLPFINEIYKEYDELKLDDVIVADASEDYKGIADAAVIISNLPYTIIAGLHTIALRPTSLIKGYFLYHIFKTENFKRFGYKIGTGLKVFGISYNNLAKYKVYYPQEIEEQEKIIGILSNLTNSINLHERKCEELTLIKKALLQELFPKKDEIKPEVRYKNFSDAWEQRRLGEGTIKIGDGLHGTPKYSTNGDVQFINGNNLINGKVVVTSETKKVTSSEQSKDDKELNQNTILMSINGTIGSLAWYRNENLMLGKSVAYIEVSKFDKKFVYTYLQTDKVKYYFMNSLTGTTIKNLGLKAIRETPLLIPNIEEQQKIGSFFQHLDSLIALHQRKLEKLKQLKKFLLQNMFI